MSKSQLPKRKSPLARRLVGAAFAATLLSGALVTGAVLVPATAGAAGERHCPTSVSLRLPVHCAAGSSSPTDAGLCVSCGWDSAVK